MIIPIRLCKREKYLITGIGINTKITPSNKDFKSTSLKNNSSKSGFTNNKSPFFILLG
jgi:hypothetical protein